MHKKTSSFLDTVGDTYRDFQVIHIEEISELQCTLKELVHTPSGASIMHVENEDPENLFCLSFKTHPGSSNGVAHILEHTVLCGSRNYPVKDPFFSMTRRSLHTYMNALTGSDFTCYPAASQVEKDFYNLLDVYIDAVFHPKLNHFSFLQEGHRLEFSDEENTKSLLEYKGIVYNEMKGSLATSDARLWHAMMELLFPDLPYKYNSGGDPKDIPALTYEELIDFHETYYHPSRCLFFFYGNFPLKKHLDYIEEKALHNAPKLSQIPPLPKQKRFEKPILCEREYPLQEIEDISRKNIVAFGFLTASLQNQEDVIALSLLDSILMDTDASILKKKLLESGLCIDVESYIDVEMSEVPYEFVFKGCLKEDAENLHSCLFSALQEIIDSKIPKSLIDSSLHQLEFTRMEITGDHAPFGLTLFLRSALAKQHGCPPQNALKIHELFEKIIEKIKDPNYLPSLLQKYFIDNPHFVRLTFTPSLTLATEEANDEKHRLEKIQASLSEMQKETIVKQAEELQQFQQKTESQSLECLPKVTLDDVPLMGRNFILTQKETPSFDVFTHDCFTNHIAYLDLVFDMPHLSFEDLSYVQLFLNLLTEVGVGNRDFEENLNFLHANVGGISAFAGLYLQADSPGLAKPAIHIRSKALYRNADKLFSLVSDTAKNVRFDEKKRIEEVLLQIRSLLEDKLNRNALKYALQLAFSGLSSGGKILHAWHGLDSYKMIERITSNPDVEIPKLIQRFESLKEKLLCCGRPKLILSCEEDFYRELEKAQFYDLKSLPSKPIDPWKGDYPVSPVNSQMRPISSPVAFTAQTFKTIGYMHPDAPALSLASFILENKILHHEIREKGGAYGCGATYSPTSGSFYFFSYRDPHIARTLDVFEKSIEAISSQKFNEQDLEEAKLSMIQQLDHPNAPGNRALSAYTWYREGKTKLLRQQYRETLLSVKPKEIAQITEKELLSKKDLSIIVSLAGKELLTQENLVLAKKQRELPIIPI